MHLNSIDVAEARLKKNNTPENNKILEILKKYS
jgi:hypothetical protein